jgi:hypothetical protein
MWKGWGDFFLDLIKKEIVTIVSVPILTFATIVYVNSIAAAVSSFRLDFYTGYWYLVIASFLVGVLAGYSLYKNRTFFPILVVSTIALIGIFSAYRLHLLPTMVQNFPMWGFFLIYLLALFNLVVVMAFVVWRIVANIATTGTRSSAST